MNNVYDSSKGDAMNRATSYDNGKIGAAQTEHPQSTLQKVVSKLDQQDASARYQLEADDHQIQSPVPSIARNNGQERHMISWTHNDPENPYNWSPVLLSCERRKAFIVFICIMTVTNSTLGSSLPSNAIPFIGDYFGITDQNQLILPISIYLVGYVLGPLLFGPLSEQFGRKFIMIASFAGFSIFMLGSAVAPNFAGFLIFRLLGGVCASSPITVTGGIYADLYSDPVARGRAMSLFMAATCFGPLFAPIASGFLSVEKGWRFTFWFGLFLAVVSWPPLIFLPETFGPVLLTQRARAMRSPFISSRILPSPLPSLSFLSKKRIPNLNYNPNAYAPFELEKKGFKQLATVTLTRPWRMLFFESIVMLTCLYLSLIYSVFYMYFEAYPIIFQTHYGFSPGVSGFMFLPIGVGAVGAICFFLAYDSVLRKAKKANKSWTRKEESRRLPLACIGGPLYAISLFWLGWGAKSSSFVVPMLAGVPFGMGFVLIFMALLNYLTDAYDIFAASAQAAASACRSIFGAVLPFAAKPMYNKLGIAWASSLLGFLSLAMCIIPFAFIAYGESIRESSRFCTYLKEKREEETRLEEERERGREIGRGEMTGVGGAEEKA